MIDLTDGRAVAWAVARHFAAKRLCGVAVEFGVRENLRIDVLGMNYWGEILAAEVKVSRADWQADMKVGSYLKFCDYLWLAVPAGLITVAEFKEWRRRRDAGIGLMYVGDQYEPVRIVERAARQRISMTDRCDVAFRMASRAGDPGFCPRCGHRASAQAGRGERA